MKSVSIIGQGRFGKLLADILQPSYKVSVFDPELSSSQTLKECGQADSIFVAVPISEFEQALNELLPHIKQDATIIDVCSVKVYPVEVMQRLLPPSVDIVATHPMFGPDSYPGDNLKIVMHDVRNQHGRYQEWQQWFRQVGINVIDMSPEEHDRYSAYSQALTHVIGRAMASMPVAKTPIDTLNFRRLMSIVNVISNDSEQLFKDLLRYNASSGQMLDDLIAALEKIREDKANDFETN